MNYSGKIKHMHTQHLKLSILGALLLSTTFACSGSDNSESPATDMTSMTQDMSDMDTTPVVDMADMNTETDASVDMPTTVDMPDDLDMSVVEDMTPDQDQGAMEDMDDTSDMTDMSESDCIGPDVDVTTREGHLSDGWRWTKQGRVFAQDPAGAAAGEGDFAPSIITEPGGGYRIYFARRRGVGFTLWTATSQDGLSWTDAVEVMGLEEGNYPAAIRQQDGSVKLWFGSGSFDVATSQDGVTFSDQQRLILTPSQVGTFGSVSLIYPEVRQVPGSSDYNMWFMGFDGQEFRIGTAQSADGVDWTPQANAILESRGGTEYDSSAVGQPEVWYGDDAMYMWHGGYDTSNTNPGPWRIALARSTDNGATWERQGISLPLAETGDDMWSTRDPAVIKKADGSGWLMVYVGMRSDSVYRLLTATSDVCLDSD